MKNFKKFYKVFFSMAVIAMLPILLGVNECVPMYKLPPKFVGNYCLDSVGDYGYDNTTFSAVGYIGIDNKGAGGRSRVIMNDLIIKVYDSVKGKLIRTIDMDYTERLDTLGMYAITDIEDPFFGMYSAAEEYSKYRVFYWIFDSTEIVIYYTNKNDENDDYILLLKKC